MTAIMRSSPVVVMSNKYFCLIWLGCSLLLSACQSQPIKSAVPIVEVQPVVVAPERYTTPTGVTIIPYDVEPIIQKSL